MSDPDSVFTSVGWALVRLRWLAALVVLVGTAAALASIRADLRIDSSTEYFLGLGSPVVATLDEFREDFGRDDLHVVLVEGDVFSPMVLDRLRALRDDIERLQVDVDAPHATPTEPDDPFGDMFAGFGDDGWETSETSNVVDEVVNLLDFRQTVHEDGAVRVRGLFDDWPTEAELPALKVRALADPHMVGTVLDADGTHTVLGVRTRLLGADDIQRVNDALVALADRHQADGFTVYITGLPDLTTSISQGVKRDMGVLTALAFLVMSGILFVLFRHPVGVVGPIAAVLLSVIWTFGGMAALGIPLSVTTNIVPSFLFCVGIGDAIHIQSAYRERRARGMEHHASIASAIGATGLPVLFTTLTTMAGLLAFQTASTAAVRDLGLAGALGVVIAMVLSLLILPFTLGFDRRGGLRLPDRRRLDRTGRLLSWTTRLTHSVGDRRRTLALFAALLGVAAVGISQLRVYHNGVTWFDPDHRTRIAMEAFDHSVGSVGAAHVVVHARGDDLVTDLEILRGLQALETEVTAWRHAQYGDIVTSATSLLDVLRETNRALHGGDPASYVLPDDQPSVSQALLLFENADPDAMRTLVSGDLKRTHLTFRLHWLDATSYQPFVAFLDDAVDRHLGEVAEVQATGTVHHTIHILGSLVRDMLRSLGFAFAVVALMLFGLLRDLRLGLIALVPALLPIAFILGFMGYTGIPIDVANLLIASIVIGIAVDDTVHYLHHFRVERSAGASVEASIQRTLSLAGRAMVTTSVILGVGFLVFVGSALNNLQRFGVVVAVTCTMALMVSLILTPALLRIFFKEATP